MIPLGPVSVKPLGIRFSLLATVVFLILEPLTCSFGPPVHQIKGVRTFLPKPFLWKTIVTRQTLFDSVIVFGIISKWGMSKGPQEVGKVTLMYFLPQDIGTVHLGDLFSSMLLKLDTTLEREEYGELGPHKEKDN